MHESIEWLQAPSSGPLNLWFEPWAEGIAFPPNATIELRITASSAGQLRIEKGEQGSAVYSWPGATLHVYVSGELVRDFVYPFPEDLLPLGKDMKESFEFLFGPPPSGKASRAKNKKPWWKFWRSD